MPVNGWILIDVHPTQGRAFQRPLDVLELWFVWNGLFSGASDSFNYYELRLLNGSQDTHLFSEANIAKAWVSTKRRHPLAGATLRSAGDAPLRLKADTDPKTDNGMGFASQPYFVVREHDLATIRPHEIVSQNVACSEEVQQLITTILNGPRPLSEELLVQLYVFREINPKRTDTLHLMLLIAHCVADRIANNALARCFLDTLARGDGSEPVQIPLEDRLAMTVPSMELLPMHLRSLSPAIKRWRKAAGIIIFRLRMAKRQGGHTLPCRLTRSTPHVAARSGMICISLTPMQTDVVRANCRLHGIPFGIAYHALAQVAMTRVLYRRYLRGEISEEEWAYRKRQPHIGGGPLSLRPYLDKAWFEKGGGGEFMMSISLFHYQLPFMTLGRTTEPHRLLDGAPPFSDLLTFDRFLHRAGLIKKQMVALFSHPLFFEIVYAVGLTIVHEMQLDTLQWMNRTKAAEGRIVHSESDEVLAVTDIPMICAHTGSSFGDVDLMSPTEYPLPPSHPLSPYSSVPHPVKAGYANPPSPPPSMSEVDTTPKFTVINSSVHLRTRPAELYLGANSMRGQLNMDVFYDKNVYEEAVVREWLNEVREAVLWYLGRTHRTRRTQKRKRPSVGGGQSGGGRGVRVKL